MEAAPGASARLAKQRTKDTEIEVRLRRALHAQGLRFRLHRRPLSNVRREADVLFGPARVAVMIDGCFWHGCPDHGTWPRNNEEFWRTKIEGNQRRDRQTDAMLAEAGWICLRVWEHEDPDAAAAVIATLVRARRCAGAPARN